MDGRSEWKRFLRKHWGIVGVFAVAAVLAFIGSVYVFLWFVSNAQSSGLVPSSLGLWTIGNLLTFIVHLIFWELLLIGIPIAIAGVIAWQWWRRIPDEKWGQYRFSGRRRTSGGGGVGLFFFLVFSIKVYVGGK